MRYDKPIETMDKSELKEYKQYLLQRINKNKETLSECIRLKNEPVTVPQKSVFNPCSEEEQDQILMSLNNKIRQYEDELSYVEAML